MKISIKWSAEATPIHPKKKMQQGPDSLQNGKSLLQFLPDGLRVLALTINYNFSCIHLRGLKLHAISLYFWPMTEELQVSAFSMPFFYETSTCKHGYAGMWLLTSFYHQVTTKTLDVPANKKAIYSLVCLKLATFFHKNTGQMDVVWAPTKLVIFTGWVLGLNHHTPGFFSSECVSISPLKFPLQNG